MNTIFPDFWEFLEHAQTACAGSPFRPAPTPFREPGYEATYTLWKAEKVAIIIIIIIVLFTSGQEEWVVAYS